MNWPGTQDDFKGEWKPSGSQFNYRECPVCKSTAWKVYFNPDSGAWCCFAGSCGARGYVTVPYSPSKIIRKLYGVKNPLPSWPEVGLPPFLALGEGGMRFLERYRMEAADARKFLLVEGKNTLANRIIIPYANSLGEIIYWNSRSTDGSEPKYKAMGGRHPLYVPHYIASKPDSGTLVLVEGAFDAMKINLHTPYRAVALGGKQLPQYLLPPLLEVCRKHLIVALDNDALAETLRLKARLEPFVDSVTARTLPPGEDPGSMSADQLMETFK